MTQLHALPVAGLPGPVVMGIVNVTPDSFSDGGHFADTERAIAHGLKLMADGADVLDIGGESTRPGATRPVLAEELDRVVPVISALAEAGGVVSVDTMRSEVAAAAVAAGASVINDVSGSLADPAILDVAAQTGAVYLAMHWRAHSTQMQADAFTHYEHGVVRGVCHELEQRVAEIRAAGIDDEQVVLDPGLGFAKKPHDNWLLLRALDEIESLGFPLLVGASRKTFLGTLLADVEGVPRPITGREHATAALTLLLAQQGVWGVRVHDVAATQDALAVWRSVEGLA